MDIRMIAMDLDGTALQNDRCSFSPRLHAALEEAHKRGIEIAVITGRQSSMLPPAVQNHPVWENLVVLCNGAQIRRMTTGEVLYARNISREALVQLLKLAKVLDIPIEFSVDSVLYLTPNALNRQLDLPHLDFHVNTILANHGMVVPSLESLLDAAVEKVNLPHIPPHLHKQAEELLKDIAVSAVWSSPNSIEITHPEAQKGIALEALCGLLKIPIENTLALGDSGNDESMLKKAGLGIAMGNAPDFIKQIADGVSETNARDGAAIAIERYALNM